MAAILVVDDEPKIVEILERYLKNHGHEVIPSVTGDDAIRNIKALSSLDLVITDLKMPGSSGIDVLKAAREAKIPIIIFSAGLGVTALKEQLTVLGYSEEEFLYKPINFVKLMEMVNKKISARPGK